MVQASDFRIINNIFEFCLLVVLETFKFPEVQAFETDEADNCNNDYYAFSLQELSTHALLVD